MLLLFCLISAIHTAVFCQQVAENPSAANFLGGGFHQCNDNLNNLVVFSEQLLSRGIISSYRNEQYPLH